MSVTSLRSPVRELACGYDGPVFVSCFFSWPSSRILTALNTAQSELLRIHPKVYSLSVIPDFGVAPAQGPAASAGERDQLIDLTVAAGVPFESSTVASAIVILPKGMLGVLIRTFMATAMLNPRMRTKVATVSSLAEAEASFRAVKGGPALPPQLSESVAAWLQTLMAAADKRAP